jgi:hypothetical protein
MVLSIIKRVLRRELPKPFPWKQVTGQFSRLLAKESKAIACLTLPRCRRKLVANDNSNLWTYIQIFEFQKPPSAKFFSREVFGVRDTNAGHARSRLRSI